MAILDPLASGLRVHEIASHHSDAHREAESTDGSYDRSHFLGRTFRGSQYRRDEFHSSTMNRAVRSGFDLAQRLRRLGNASSIVPHLSHIAALPLARPA